MITDRATEINLDTFLEALWEGTDAWRYVDHDLDNANSVACLRHEFLRGKIKCELADDAKSLKEH